MPPLPALSSSRPFLARAALLGSAVCFGLMAVLARLLTRPEMGFTPGQLAVLRFGVGVVVCLGAFRVWPGLYAPRNLKILILRGISGGLVVVLDFDALAHIRAGEAGLIYNLFPVFASLMALYVFKERPTVHLFLAVLAASAGVVLVLGQGSLVFRVGRGELAALAAALFAAASAIAIRQARPENNATVIFFFFSLVGLPVVAPFALDPWPRVPLAWAVGVVMSLAALGAQVLMAEAYGTLSITEAAIWLQLTPIATYLLALPLLGEPVTAFGLAGILLTVAGVAYGTAWGSRKTP